jgi:hypothetical protein
VPVSFVLFSTPPCLHSSMLGEGCGFNSEVSYEVEFLVVGGHEYHITDTHRTSTESLSEERGFTVHQKTQLYPC